MHERNVAQDNHDKYQLGVHIGIFRHIKPNCFHACNSCGRKSRKYSGGFISLAHLQELYSRRNLNYFFSIACPMTGVRDIRVQRKGRLSDSMCPVPAHPRFRSINPACIQLSARHFPQENYKLLSPSAPCAPNLQYPGQFLPKVRGDFRGICTRTVLAMAEKVPGHSGAQKEYTNRLSRLRIRRNVFVSHRSSQ